MKCPIDGTDLVMTDRAGVEIDYCPTCRGVWLDRGELDKIIERSAAPTPAAPRPEYTGKERYDDDGFYEGKSRTPKKKKRMGGFLEEIFDF